MKMATEVRTALGFTPGEMAKVMGMKEITTWKDFEKCKNPSKKHLLRLIDVARKHLGWDLSDCLAALYED